MAGLSPDNVVQVTGEFDAMWLEDMGAEFKAGDTDHPLFHTKRTTLATVLARREAEASKLAATDGEIEAGIVDLNLDCVNFRQAVGIAKGKKSREYKRVPKLPGGGTSKKPAAGGSSGGSTT